MPRFDHTGRGMGRCGGKTANAAGRGMGNGADADQNAQDAGMGAGPGMGQNVRQNIGQGRCCRHGHQHNRGGNCAANNQEACQGMGRGQGRGRGRGMQQGNGPAGQAESCGAGPAAGSDAAVNNG